MSEFNCPKCGSDQTVKCSAVYAAGTTAIETKTTGMGVGLSKGGFVPVVGSGTTTGVQQTQLAAQLAPPAKEQTVKQFFGGTFLLAPILGIVVAFVIGLVSDWSETAVVGTFLVVTALVAILNLAACVVMYRQNRDEWPKLYEEWERHWYCAKCESLFIPDPSAKPILSLAMPETPFSEIPAKRPPNAPVVTEIQGPIARPLFSFSEGLRSPIRGGGTPDSELGTTPLQAMPSATPDMPMISSSLWRRASSSRRFSFRSVIISRSISSMIHAP